MLIKANPAVNNNATSDKTLIVFFIVVIFDFLNLIKIDENQVFVAKDNSID
jgi:hypothetical protein